MLQTDPYCCIFITKRQKRQRIFEQQNRYWASDQWARLSEKYIQPHECCTGRTVQGFFGIFGAAKTCIDRTFGYKLLTGELHTSIRDSYAALYKLVNATYWYPIKGVDSDEDFGMLFAEHQRKLKNIVKEYLNFVNANIQKDTGNLQAIHRLIEVIQSNAPRFGQVLNFSDLSFEHRHQALKTSCERNNHQCDQSLL